MKKLILFISALMLLAGCETDEEKIYHISFIVNAIQHGYDDPIPYEIYIKDRANKVLSQLKLSNNTHVYDHKGRLGEALYISCTEGPADLSITSYNSTFAGDYEIEEGDEMIIQIDIE